MDEAVQRYLDAIPPEQKPLFERLQSLILQLYPDAEIVISYQIPVQGESRTRLDLWKNGVSLHHRSAVHPRVRITAPDHQGRQGQPGCNHRRIARRIFGK